MTATRPGTTRSSTPWSSRPSVPSQKFAGTYRASRRAWRPPAIPHVHPVCAGITSGPSHDDRARYAHANFRLATLEAARGIHVRAPHDHLEVQVRTGGEPGRPDEADAFARHDPFARSDGGAGEMR